MKFAAPLLSAFDPSATYVRCALVPTRRCLLLAHCIADALVEEPRHLSCPTCCTGFCAACGQRWALDEEEGTSHLGATCSDYFEALNAAAMRQKQVQLLQADPSIGDGTKLCPNPHCEWNRGTQT